MRCTRRQFSTNSTSPLMTNCAGDMLTRTTSGSSGYSRRQTGELPACLGEDPAAHVDHEAGLLGHRDEGGCRQQAARRMLPADEGLDGEQLAGAQVDFRLEVQAQPVALDGLPQRQLRL